MRGRSRCAKWKTALSAGSVTAHIRTAALPVHQVLQLAVAAARVLNRVDHVEGAFPLDGQGKVHNGGDIGLQGTALHWIEQGHLKHGTDTVNLGQLEMNGYGPHPAKDLKGANEMGGQLMAPWNAQVLGR